MNPSRVWRDQHSTDPNLYIIALMHEDARIEMFREALGAGGLKPIV
jgi:hypothetical protein